MSLLWSGALRYNLLRMMKLLLLTCCFLVLSVSCNRDAPPPAQDKLHKSSLRPIKVTPKASLLYTYAKADGTFETVDKLEQVPAPRRGWVRVVDIKVKPVRRHDHQLVYVADLRSPGKDGSYPYDVLPRAVFESAAVNRAGQGASDPPPAPGAAPPTSAAAGGQVVLYATSWCGACRAARQYMTSNKIAFVEKDIEKDQAAAVELRQKARKAGISASGVPVLDVGGTLMEGFNPARLEALLASQPKAPAKK